MKYRLLLCKNFMRDTMKSHKKKRLVFINNHFDLFWRRAAERPIPFEGKNFAPYSQIQDTYLRDQLALARQIPDYKFEVESVTVLRGCLSRHPGWLPELQKLAAEKRFTVSGAGENIVDSNLINGECIIRNYLLGYLWVEENLGRKTKLAVRNDAFGNSAQLPQILRGCEIERATGFHYSVPDGTLWRGLDGTELSLASLPECGRAHAISKLRPCPDCNGNGCETCENTGMELRRCPPPPLEKIEKEAKAGIIYLAPEEMLPYLEIDAWRKELSAHFDVEFALGEDADAYLPADAGGKRLSGTDLNPNNTGCYVSRIKLKQTCRRQEYELLALETLCVAARNAGKSYPAAELNAIWRELLRTQFHDSVTGTIVDSAYEELCEIQAEIDRRISTLRTEILAALTVDGTGKITILQLHGSPFSGVVSADIDLKGARSAALTDSRGNALMLYSAEALENDLTRLKFHISDLPPYSAETVTVKPVAAAPETLHTQKMEIKNQRFCIIADACGITSIFDRKLGAELCRAGEYHIGEAILESDEGSPWATLKNSMERFPAGNMKYLETLERSGEKIMRFDLSIEELTFAGASPFAATLDVILRDSAERIDFKVNVSRWDAANARIRIAFPLPFKGAQFCEIPYGTLRREVYKPVFSWNGATGDWPALNWSGVEGSSYSVALFNRGTPGYKLEDVTQGGSLLLLSVLRSPVIPTFLHEPWDYSMTAFYGMRDVGTHAFEFALTSYDGPFAQSSVTADAEAYTAGVLAVSGEVMFSGMAQLQSECVRLASVKMAETGNAQILRLAEYRGTGGTATIRLPEGAAAISRVNLLERNGTVLPVQQNSIEISIRPWEIVTLRCEYETTQENTAK